MEDNVSEDKLYNFWEVPIGRIFENLAAPDVFISIYPEANNPEYAGRSNRSKKLTEDSYIVIGGVTNGVIAPIIRNNIDPQTTEADKQWAEVRCRRLIPTPKMDQSLKEELLSRLPSKRPIKVTI